MNIDNIYKRSWIITLIFFVLLLSMKYCSYFDPAFNKVFNNRINIYPDFLVSLSIFFGFTLTAISLIISMSEMTTFTEFRNKNEHAGKMWDSYLNSLKYLGVSSFIVLALIIFDQKEIPSKMFFQYFLSVLRWCFLFVFLKSIEKLLWNFIILTLLIDAIKKDWKDKRDKFKEETKEKLKAQSE